MAILDPMHISSRLAHPGMGCNTNILYLLEWRPNLLAELVSLKMVMTDT